MYTQYRECRLTVNYLCKETECYMRYTQYVTKVPSFSQIEVLENPSGVYHFMQALAILMSPVR